MNQLDERLANLRRLIDAACRRAGHAPAHVRLLAVGKGFGADDLAAAWAAGLREFGESYAQEAIPKIGDLAQRGILPVWHFIGPLQSNKTRAVAGHFSWVHGLDRQKIAERLSAQRPPLLPPLEVCVQVNISAEAGKAGCAPTDAAGLCEGIARLPQLRLRGLMTIPRAADLPEDSRPAFRAMRELFDRIRADGGVDPAQFDTLSMGMSGDFGIAIEEGATIVRIGAALFGKRGI